MCTHALNCLLCSLMTNILGNVEDETESLGTSDSKGTLTCMYVYMIPCRCMYVNTVLNFGVGLQELHCTCTCIKIFYLLFRSTIIGET